MTLETLEASYLAEHKLRSSPKTGIRYTETFRDFHKYPDSVGVRTAG